MRQKSWKLLLVEDDRDSAEALIDLFELHHIETVWNVDRSSALQTLDSIEREGERPPDFALLDLNLPDTDSVGLGREVIAHPMGCPVVLVSASSSQQLDESTQRVGAIAALRKPFTMESLLAVLRRESMLGARSHALSLAAAPR